MTALIVATLLTMSPTVDCSLVVNGNNLMGGTKLTQDSVTGHARSREHYTLSFKDIHVQAKLAETAPLMSVTWQPTPKTQATFTCTSKVVKPREDQRKVPIVVACFSASGHFSIGANKVELQSNTTRVSASATGYEMRVQAESPTHGVVIVWSDHSNTHGNGTTITVDSNQFSCWRM